ncbi:DUF58 domain-containing protein [Mycolicibacterium sp. 018/SC-01/001]|uniref:DUF58 domain-containing protein n=1 Tax=Mycolicibacterium sp. 018/SC-01/001 TaxID=2592069 RepID=UPI00117ED319|nr:DUF58 domain-containing protein [Mycolicibacterium sp. 018/SC-01/001]TRW86369.1 DUF58 domain-containing protein [Mycolicibacterium sp. 018/SC-01/001]
MGKLLGRVRAVFGTDTRGMLDGGRHALLHTRTLEFDDLRPYVPGDDVRDIDWKASARSGDVLIKRFVSEKHHKVLLVADTGRDMTARTPSGETKGDVAALIAGAIGLITLGRSDEIGMVSGDRRGSVNVRLRRGETHIESMLHRYHDAGKERAASDIVCQLDYVATHYRHPLLIVIVSDEPDVDDRLADVLGRLAARHDLLWAMVADRPPTEIGRAGGYDVGTLRSVLTSAATDGRVIAAYHRAETRRRQRLAEMLADNAIPHVTVAGSAEVRDRIAELTRVRSRAG